MCNFHGGERARLSLHKNDVSVVSGWRCPSSVSGAVCQGAAQEHGGAQGVCHERRAEAHPGDTGRAGLQAPRVHRPGPPPADPPSRPAPPCPPRHEPRAARGPSFRSPRAEHDTAARSLLTKIEVRPRGYRAASGSRRCGWTSARPDGARWVGPPRLAGPARRALVSRDSSALVRS